jgi:6-phosphogluconate dehydrogenase
MQIGLVGLGKMGAGITRRLCRADIHVAGFDGDPRARTPLAAEAGFAPVASLDALLLAVRAPRIVWSMLPSGKATREVLDGLLAKLSPGDIVVDGANGHYRDAMANAERYSAGGIGFVDAGVSGGVHGLANGYAIMLGGRVEDVASLGRVLNALAPGKGQWLHCGPSGAGHFVKMVHNGIEYGLMQAYAEGFALLRGRPEFALDLAAIADNWGQGGVIRSWLLELTRDVLRQDATLEGVAPIVADSGEGRWSAEEAIAQGVPAPVITAALMQRFSSQGKGDFAARVLAMMRNRFGGHSIPETKP